VQFLLPTIALARFRNPLYSNDVSPWVHPFALLFSRVAVASMNIDPATVMVILCYNRFRTIFVTTARVITIFSAQVTKRHTLSSLLVNWKVLWQAQCCKYQWSMLPAMFILVHRPKVTRGKRRSTLVAQIMFTQLRVSTILPKARQSTSSTTCSQSSR